jgi:hypothetical protein
MHRAPFSHALDPGLDRVAGDGFLIGSERSVEREPRVARLLMQSRVPIPDAIGKRGERSKIRFGLGKLGLQRALQLLEIRTPCIVRGLGLRNNGVPLQLLGRIQLEVALSLAQQRQRVAAEQWLRHRAHADAAQRRSEKYSDKNAFHLIVPSIEINRRAGGFEPPPKMHTLAAPRCVIVSGTRE